MPLALFVFATVSLHAQSALDGFDPNANDRVVSIAVQPDGKILLGGDFTSLSPNGGAAVTRNHLARLNPDGTLDTAFNPNPNGGVGSIVVQADGKILVGGSFTNIGGQPRNRIARLDGTNGLADSFDPNADNPVYRAVVQPDGKILVSGSFFSIGGQPRYNIARLDPVTGLADSFKPDANGSVSAMVVLADGKILVGGNFTRIGGQTRQGIARLDATTGLADSFDPVNGNFAIVVSIVLQPDGKILVGGGFGYIGGQSRRNIARLDATTGAADSFDPHANGGGTIYSIALQPDGRILVGGVFTDIGGQPRNRIARLNSTTGLAESFNPNANGIFVYSVAVQADGKILACGDFTALAPNGGVTMARNRMARLETDGRVDQTLNINGAKGDIFYIAATAVQPDGKILIGGDFTAISGVPRNFLARLNTDGTIDPAFDPSPSYQVYAIAMQPDGRILVGGLFHTVGGEAHRNLVRLDGVTGLPDSFDPNPNEQVNAISVQKDGKILVGGRFTSIGGATRHRIARLDPVTGLADSFDPSPNGDAYGIFSLAAQLDGKILAGGDFFGANSIGGQARNGIARLESGSGLADLFNPNANSLVYAIAVRPDGKILAGGTFSSIGGAPRRALARLDAEMGLADTFDAQGENGPVETLALQVDGKVLAGGNFGHLGGQRRESIARLDGASGLSDSFDPNAQSPIEVLAIAIQPDGKILVGGNFSGPGSMGGQERQNFARLSNDTPALQNLSVTQASVTWTRGGSSPNLTRATFEFSDDGLNYTLLGHATESGTNWGLTGLDLPIGVNIYVRARGYYPGGNLNGSESITESVRNAFLLQPSDLGNISTRLRVETGDNVLIGGFIVTGTQPKRVILRAIGPSLPLAGALADPILELRDSSGGLIRSNDDWRSDQEAEIIATGIPPSDNLESAIVATLPANGSAYTAIVRGVSDATGIGLVEAYDLDRTVDSKLTNISTRGFVQTDENVLIAGTIVLGQASQRVIVRAIGPSLSVPGKLEDPALELRDANGGLIRSNDNWRSDQEAEIIATGIPPANNLESAIVATLPANGAAYTAIVRGVDGTTGVAVVEVYALN